MKEWITKFNEKIDSLATSKWLHYLRITGGVAWNLALIFIVAFVILGVFAVSVGAGYFASLVEDEPLRSEEEMRNMIFNYEETSEVYFANNVYLGKLRTDLDRRETSLAKVSPNVINAVLATEDEYFREHNGIVPKAVIRGLLQDVSNSSTQTGGSTLTQQLIKNQILTNEVSYERKAKEILLAFRLEKFMEKEEILEAYLNIIPYGRNANGRNIAGIETAAEGIFGVMAADLNLAQSAYIAGIPQAPFKYTPFTNKGERKSPELMQAGIDRMKTVLYRMKEVGFINEAEYEAAINYDITKDFREPEQRAEDKYPWLADEIEKRAIEILRDILAEQDGINPSRLKEEDNLKEKYEIIAARAVRLNGYRIYTTINKEMYDAMNAAAVAYENYGHTYTETVIEDGEEVTRPLPVQIGSMAMETKTGKILAFVGGRDFSIEQTNHATRAPRSNGSTMKPLIVYGPAIEYGMIGAGSPVVDVKIENYDWALNNYNKNEERGLVSAREALEDSLNIPAGRLYMEMLNRRPAEYLLQLGVSNLHPLDFETPATSLGSLNKGITVEENTNAYQAFANSGQFIDGYMIEKIVDLDGNVIYEHKIEPVQVYSPETAYILTDMMRGVLTEGTGVSAKNTLKFNADFAAKTGTTSSYGDVWFMGYNPNVTLGVWLGYRDLKLSLGTFNNQYGHPSTRINRLWASLMNSLYDVNPEFIGTSERFVRPPNVVSASFCGISGMKPTEACSDAGLVRTDLFNKAVFLPTQPDDSLTSGATVYVNGNKYPALPSTPSEFVSVGGGVGLSQSFVERVLGKLGGDASKLLRGISTIADSDSESGGLVEDSVPPSAVTANLSGNSIVWKRSSSNDVVGYRIYTITNGSRRLVDSVISNETYSFTVSKNIEYIVVAVDITGLESPASNIVSLIESPEPSPSPGPGNSEPPGNGNKPPGGRPGDDGDGDDDGDNDSDDGSGSEGDSDSDNNESSGRR